MTTKPTLEEAAATVAAALERAKALRAEAAEITRRAGVKVKAQVDPTAPRSTVARVVCNFCGAGQIEVPSIIAGPGAHLFICTECVALCVDLFEENGHPLPALVTLRARVTELEGAAPAAPEAGR